MRRQVMFVALMIVVALALAACGSDDPDHSVTTGDELFSVSFDDSSAWETGSYPADAGEPNAVLAIEDGHYQIDYRAERSASLTWGTGGEAVQDVVIEVDTEQLNEADDNLYGVACRLVEDENGDASGYLLLISGDGHFGIAELSRKSLDFVLEWHQSDQIKQGAASNSIRAACIDDYLAIYANGEFLGDVKDDRYVRDGQVALVAGTTEETSISVAFDDLTVYEGSLK